jgi:hypothetical protein
MANELTTTNPDNRRLTNFPYGITSRGLSVATVIDAQDYGLKADGATDDSAAIQAALAELAADGGGTLLLPVGDIVIASTITISTSNIMIRGQGAAGPRNAQSTIQNSATTRLKWTGSAGGTMILFESPAGGERQSGGGIADLMLDGNNFSAAIGLNIKTWALARFVGVFVFACSADHYLTGITANVMTFGVSDTQYNSFYNCHASTRGGSGTYLTSTARGFRLTGDTAAGANTSFNYFYGCHGMMAKGEAWYLENTDNNHFFACTGSAQRDATVPGMVFGSSTQDSNGTSSARFNFVYGGQLYIHFKSGQTGGTSSLGNFVFMSRANSVDLPVFETPAGGSIIATATVLDSYSGFNSTVVNQATAQQTGFATDTYLEGSSFRIVSGTVKVGTRYRLVFNVTKTAAGVATPIINIRSGFAGTTADNSRLTFTFPAQTAAVDEGRFEIDFTMRTIGTGNVSTFYGTATLTHELAATGLSVGNAPTRKGLSSLFNANLADIIIGVSVNAGASAAWTIELVEATLENLT